MHTSLELSIQRAAIAGVANAFFTLITTSDYWRMAQRTDSEDDIRYSTSKKAAWRERLQFPVHCRPHGWSIDFKDRSLGRVSLWFQEGEGLVGFFWDIHDKNVHFALHKESKPFPADLFGRVYSALVRELRNYLRRRGARVDGVEGKLLTIPKP